MTFGRITELARRWSRVTTSGASDSEVRTRISEAVEEFAKDVHGLPLKEYLALTPLFDLKTNMAFHLSITDATNGDVDADITVCTSDSLDTTGANTATTLQSRIQAQGNAATSMTVAWTNYHFTIGAIPSTVTAFEITAPSSDSYFDGTNALFGGTFDENDLVLSTTYSLTCSFPEMCTVVASLPTDIMKFQMAYYDGYKLETINWEDIIKGSLSGQPRWYSIRGDKIAVYPAPNEQKEFYILYKGIPTEISSPTSDSALPTEIPDRFQRCLANYVAAELLDETWEPSLANIQREKYKDGVRTYLRTEYGSVLNIADKPTEPLWYRVKV